MHACGEAAVQVEANLLKLSCTDIYSMLTKYFWTGKTKLEHEKVPSILIDTLNYVPGILIDTLNYVQ